MIRRPARRRPRSGWTPFQFVAAAALAVLAGTGAQAGTVTITGAPFGSDGIAPFQGYGSSVNKHNVVNFWASGISDPTGGAAWLTQGDTTPSAVKSNVSNYAVDWYFNGAESGDKNKFISGALSYTEGNQNNRYNSGNDPGWRPVGTTTGSGMGPIQFSVKDLTRNISVINGANNKPGELTASLMFAFVEPIFWSRYLLGWKVTHNETDWFAFGFDDPGSKNDNHDDYVGIGHVRALPSPVPLPGALPLMGAVLGVGFLISRWRKQGARLEDSKT